jgi:hypothetical protein
MRLDAGGKEVAGQPKRQSKAVEDYTLTISGTKNSLNMSRRCDESEILCSFAGRIVGLASASRAWCLVVPSRNLQWLLRPVGGVGIYVNDRDAKMSIFLYCFFLCPPQLSFFSSPRS